MNATTHGLHYATAFAWSDTSVAGFQAHGIRTMHSVSLVMRDGSPVVVMMGGDNLIHILETLRPQIVSLYRKIVVLLATNDHCTGAGACSCFTRHYRSRLALAQTSEHALCHCCGQ